MICSFTVGGDGQPACAWVSPRGAGAAKLCPAEAGLPSNSSLLGTFWACHGAVAAEKVGAPAGADRDALPASIRGLIKGIGKHVAAVLADALVVVAGAGGASASVPPTSTAGGRCPYS